MQSQLILFVGLQTANERMLRSAVCAEGHHVISVDCVDPQTSIERERPDLVVLNLTSFNSTEWETLRQIRDESRVPIIALTARVDPAHLLAAYQYGVDDYLHSPVIPTELAARVRATLRRAPSGGRAILTYPGVEIHLERRKVAMAGTEVRFSATEWKLLARLAAKPGQVLSTASRVIQLWDGAFYQQGPCLRTWISRLRLKLKSELDARSLITAYAGYGYRLEAPPDWISDGREHVGEIDPIAVYRHGAGQELPLRPHEPIERAWAEPIRQLWAP